MSDATVQGNVSGEEYKPFIPAGKVMPELTVLAIIIGGLMAVVFGAANAYIGLIVGMTISASIPAAVISMGIIRGILRRESILENNMVQTIGSAGESLAAGAIFTLPALFVWANELPGYDTPNLVNITGIAAIAGLLGVFLMVPLRRALIVKEHGTLPYPEGTACSEVLIAGEKGGTSAKMVFTGLGMGSAYKFIADGLNLFRGSIEWEIPGYKDAAIGADTYPALLGVGYIVGLRIASLIFSGGLLGWLVIIPLISHFGSGLESAIYPASGLISELGYWGIWDNYIRYVGAGAVAFGGIFSLIKNLPLIWSTFKQALGGFSTKSQEDSERTDQDMSIKIVLIGVVIIVVFIMTTNFIPVGFIGAIIIAIFGFFFATVSARLVGLVGSSSNPVSGMTIATLLITTAIFKGIGFDGVPGMIGALSVGTVIAIIAALAGDTSQDLKTGFLVGATPKKQQIGEIIGVIASALIIGVVLYLLSNAYGFGSKELPAPQATLMRLVIEGVMEGDLPWTLVYVGIGIGVMLELLKLPVLPIAVGLYLPIHLSTPIMIGGIVKGLLERKKNLDEKEKEHKVRSGVLYASGLVAGEGLIGILLAIFAVIPVADGMLGDSINIFGGVLGQVGGLIFFALLVLSLVAASFWNKRKIE
ncbi:MAG: oligopeptide transporter, OPT family [Spirochaetia bacterium]